MEIHLQEMRKRAGLKQAEIAERLNVKVRTYGSWERGEAMMSTCPPCPSGSPSVAFPT